jgi:RNA polymerase sigma-70 factor (ECF subfamily)
LQEIALTTQRLSEIERDLVKGCTLNDRIAQRELYNKYCNAMFSTAYRILNNYENAQDALQDAFIQVFRDIQQFRGSSTLGAWIKTIVVRTALHKLQKDRHLGWENLERDHENVVIHIPDFMSSEYLEKAILSLPDGCRTIFLLVEVEGYTHAEAAKMLNITIGTSKSQLFHARYLLKQRLSLSIEKK